MEVRVYEASEARVSPVTWYLTYQVMWRAAPSPAVMGVKISFTGRGNLLPREDGNNACPPYRPQTAYV